VAQFIGEVPLIGQRPLSPMARSSLQASALFETNALPYTQENIDKLTTTSEDIEYVIDQDQGVIYTTRKDSLIAYMDEPPLVALFKQYKEKKKEFKTFLTDFSEQKNDSSPADLTQTIFKLEKIFTTKLNPLDLNTFKALPESDANLIETIMNRLIIINSSEKYIAVMERAKKEFPKQGLSTLRALLYQYSTDEPNDEALRSEINGLSEKDLFTRMNSVMKTLPKRKARVMQSKINNVSQRNSQVVGEIDRAIQILENTEDIFTLSEEVGTGLISFLSRLYSESIIVTNPQDLMNYIGNFTQVTVSRAFRYKEELNYLKLRIEFYNSLFESRGIQLR
jgi:flagellin-specific chaperone FliS